MLRHTWNKAQHLLEEERVPHLSGDLLRPPCGTTRQTTTKPAPWSSSHPVEQPSSIIMSFQFNWYPPGAEASSAAVTWQAPRSHSALWCCDVPPREWLIPKITVTCIASKSCCARSLWHFLSAVKEINLELNCQRMPYPPDLTEDQRIMSRDDDLLLI